VTVRLAAGVLVSALIRRVQGLGGNAAVLARGDSESGGILLFLSERGIGHGFFERSLETGGEYVWRQTVPKKIEDLQYINEYIERRRTVDGDLWVVELDIPGVERFAAEMIGMG
jgi:hypothetical protein